MIMRPGRIVVVMATVSALFVPSGLSERIKYKSTKNEGATILLPECDVVKIESKKSCRQDYSEIGLQVAWNSHSLNASSLFRCYCESLVGGIYIEYFDVSSIQLEISREILQASPYCNMKISDPKLRTLKGRTLTISSGEEMEWELYIPGDCNTNLTWKTATFATGAVAILFLAATLSLAVCILLQKQNTRSSRGKVTFWLSRKTKIASTFRLQGFKEIYQQCPVVNIQVKKPWRTHI
ncbi:uncharacterized protein [Macrobrachium rosenbergii]|uniref:uncharacterized protein isoform X2 n=1 Tax=Macrobrachium rosenbergii TaxID=79674 RepID=UPI0034D6E7D4